MHFLLCIIAVANCGFAIDSALMCFILCSLRAVALRLGSSAKLQSIGRDVTLTGFAISRRP
jgi:hypothetical protein